MAARRSLYQMQGKEEKKMIGPRMKPERVNQGEERPEVGFEGEGRGEGRGDGRGFEPL